MKIKPDIMRPVTHLLKLTDCSAGAGALGELTVGVIGGGHLGKRLARALQEGSGITPANIRVSSRRPETLQELSLMEIECFYDNQRLASWADVLFLCCLPCHLSQVCDDIRAHLPRHCVVYSFVSNAPVKRLSQLLGHTSILRPAYQLVPGDAEWQGPPSVMAALKDVEAIAASCPLSMSCGVRLGTGWLPAVLYSLLNMCSSVLPPEGALQLLNQVLGHQSDSDLSIQPFISQSCASTLSPPRPLPWISLIDVQSRDTPLSWHLSSSSGLRKHLLSVYLTTLTPEGDKEQEISCQ
ncbi:NADP-dependent oxidoreductase domain-containing protein 1 [Sardina pilchardus]|uniref:NADP-dependent oxidoreductase domain-containing protein 1 n=1 Tax=Sardina pilchardus TaxID=27697 RepID=UPI002E0FAADC